MNIRFNTALAVGGISVVSLFVLFPTLFFPFVRDQSIFAYTGKVIAAGGAPYKDIWDLKPPGIFMWFAVLFRVCGGGIYQYMGVVHAADVACITATAVALFFLARRFGGSESGGGCALWYVVLSYHWGFLAFSQAEQWSNLFIAYACLPMMARDGDATKARISYAAAGALCGLTVLFKYVLLPVCVPFFLFGILVTSDRIKRSLAFAIGCGVTIVAAFAWLWARGGLDAWVEIQRGFMLSYINLAQEDFSKRSDAFGDAAWKLIVPIWPVLALAVVGLILRSTRTQQLKWLSFASLFLAVVAVAIQNKFFPYHWLAALPWLSVLAAVGTVGLIEKLRIGAGWRTAVAMALPVLWWLASGGAKDHADTFRYTAGRLSKREWYQRFNDGFDFNQCDGVAAYIDRVTKPDETVLIWGFDPLIYLLANRSAPTRFITNGPLRMAACDPKWREELLRDVQKKSPALVVVATNDAFGSFGLNGTSAQMLPDWPAFNDWLTAHYERQEDVESFNVYKRVD